jgi:hypothetical protein
VQIDPDEGKTKVNVKRRGHLVVDVPIAKRGTLVGWEFRTIKNNIAFGVQFDKTQAEGKAAAAGSSTEVLKLEIQESQAKVISGSHLCTDNVPGTLRIRFDNYFSRFTSKTLLYRIDVTLPEDQVQVSPSSSATSTPVGAASQPSAPGGANTFDWSGAAADDEQ